jgi:phosphohistidine phosphatase
MGKTLFIIRHAKAKETEAGSKDIDRILSSEGLSQSSLLGNYLYKKNAEPDAIICSNAVRAVQTAELISDQINFDISKIIIEGELYEASVRIVENIVSAFSNDWQEVVLIGHNPVLTYFTEYMTGHHFEGMETGSLVKITFATKDWASVSKENASFEYYVSPDDFTKNN